MDKSTRRIRVALVDDHTMFRQGLRSVLNAYPDIAVVAEAADGEEAVAVIEEVRPDVVVMDVNMPRLNGVEATARIKARHPEIKVVGLSVNARDLQEVMSQAGAEVTIAKEGAVDELYDAIRRAVD